MFDYPVELEVAEEGGFIVTFPDVPPAITQGEDEPDALIQAVDALETALDACIDSRMPIPVPSSANGRKTVSPSPLSCAKLAIHQAMLERGIRKSDLARIMKCHLPQIDRLLDLKHASRFEQIEEALAALGKRISVSIQDAA
ncbi:MAG: type II toxin-antitoxin system HicB family antitoxin [Magnetococcales bacterium]|nr:type II toxin-antitoxin system HicB family antitoxin [Magnetococcales bacterium]